MTHMRATKALADFIQASQTPFHATQAIGAAPQPPLAITTLMEKRPTGSLEDGGRYRDPQRTHRLIAFSLGRGCRVAQGLAPVGAHTGQPMPEG